MQPPAKQLPYLALVTMASVIALSACGEKNPSAKVVVAPTPIPAVAAASTPLPPPPLPPSAAQPPAPIPPPAATPSDSAATPPAPASMATPPAPATQPDTTVTPPAQLPAFAGAETTVVYQVAQNTPPQPGASGAAQAQAAGLGTSDYEVSGVEVTLLELKRTSGDTITARWRYRNTEKDKKELTKATGWTDAWRLAWDSYLIDSTNKKKYMVLKDSEGKPIAASHGSGSIKLDGGKTLSTWAKYPAPPDNVQKITLYLPGVAPFEDVPIAK